MKRENQYRPGEMLSIHDVVNQLNDGGYVFWNNKLMHKSFLSGMPIRTVHRAAINGIIRKADLNRVDGQ